VEEEEEGRKKTNQNVRVVFLRMKEGREGGREV